MSTSQRSLSSTQIYPIRKALMNRVKNLINNQIYSGDVTNITNPHSIYIKGRLKFPGYKIMNLDCFVDTGASICLCSKYVIPEEHWKDAERSIKVKIADDSVIEINKVCENLNMYIAGECFHIPRVFMQESGIDFILGNNFCQNYEPLKQYTDRIILTLENREIIIGKIRRAHRVGVPGFLESLKKKSKLTMQKGTNIAPSKTSFDKRGELGYTLGLKKLFEEDLKKKSIIEKLLDQVCSENPLDPLKTKKWMKASIKLIDPKTVVKVKPMRYNPQDVEEFAKQIKELLELKIIIPSKSPHQSPAFLVENEAERRRGKKRMVVNYKAINTATIGDAHNLPNKDELLTLIRGKSIFSSFDCKSGFWQVLLDEDSQLLTAFTCPQGHYQWIVVPFGLKQAPSIFQRHMNNAFRDFASYCCVYVDDILVFSNNIKDHYAHVAQVLRKCAELGIILSKKKAQLFKCRINFLGLDIDEGTHRPQNHILEHIHKFPNKIEDKKQLQRFLGILTYASDYIPQLASMRAPLQEKLKEDVPWNWKHSDTEYVEEIKKSLTDFPKLHHPATDEKLIIECDASGKYWGGILKAIHQSEERICRYTSGSFKKAELNYHSNEKEILAVIRVIAKFTIYLTPLEFLIRTDNKNFTFFMNTNVKGDYKQGRLVRWQQWLSRYSFKVEHITGVKNIFADFLTREFQSKNSIEL
ncbi:replicase [Lamium leaf distortion virus]|uniref:Enzymatic polyprotein n=1 Tax=Lamium leaf distortion virus TaxID=515320 RepID=B2CXY5_9VIRU|nr:replicase [Lamium leaf distortion virus]ACB69767.1 replicase [Lamium leaf distortion virus]